MDGAAQKQEIQEGNMWRVENKGGMEWQLALEMPTSRMAHAERERGIHLQNNIKAKPEQLKLNKTYPSTWP
jgi:hypothetical protein